MNRGDGLLPNQKDPKSVLTKNSALRGLAWIGTLVIANATPLGDVVFRTAVELVADTASGQTLNSLQVLTYVSSHPDTVTIAWWISFAVFTAMATYIGKTSCCYLGRRPFQG